MIDEDLWKPRKNKRKEHRQWRQRKAHYGEMAQFDGSYEYWLEDRCPSKLCLLLAVDDASSAIAHGKFDKDEGVFPVFDFWKEYLAKNGKPMSIYLDRFSTYKMTQKQAEENHDTKTQFQRAMRELKVEPISAYSPEAKGRVERAFGVLQDRLIKEMRLRKIKTIGEANKYLQDKFIPWYNERFAIAPRSKSNLHIQLSRQEKNNINSILSKQKERTVQNDFTISFDTQWFQLTKSQPVTIQKRDKVIVELNSDDTIRIRLRGKYLNCIKIDKETKSSKKSIPWVIPATLKSTKLNRTF